MIPISTNEHKYMATYLHSDTFVELLLRCGFNSTGADADVNTDADADGDVGGGLNAKNVHKVCSRV